MTVQPCRSFNRLGVPAPPLQLSGLSASWSQTTDRMANRLRSPPQRRQAKLTHAFDAEQPSACAHRQHSRTADVPPFPFATRQLTFAKCRCGAIATNAAHAQNLSMSVSCENAVRRFGPKDGVIGPVRRLLGVGLCYLAYQLGPIHIHRTIDRTGLGPTVVFENFDHQRRVVR
jgi:hypothetical protein